MSVMLASKVGDVDIKCLSRLQSMPVTLTFNVGHFRIQFWSRCQSMLVQEIGLPVPEENIFLRFLPYMGMAAILVM